MGDVERAWICTGGDRSYMGNLFPAWFFYKPKTTRKIKPILKSNEWAKLIEIIQLSEQR